MKTTRADSSWWHQTSVVGDLSQHDEMQAVRFVRRLKASMLKVAGGDFSLDPHSRFFRGTSWIMILVLLLTSFPPSLVAATLEAPPATSSQSESSLQNPQQLFPKLLKLNSVKPVEVKVNRTVPKHDPPSLHPKFGKIWVTDEQIFRARVFEEPLIPIGGETTAEENKALSEALDKYLKGGGRDKVEPIMEFLRQNPATVWRTSLLLNLGIVYRRTGWFTKALIAWEQAWESAKNETDLKAAAIADRAVGEWASLNARVGRTDVLERIFKQVEGRQLRGPANQLMAAARDSYIKLVNTPETSCICGPLAVQTVRKAMSLESTAAIIQRIKAEKGSRKGTSLHQNWKLLNDLKMNFQIARRPAGSEIILPAIVHWNAGHFATLVREQNGLYLVQDPTFDYDIWVSQEALDNEASGYVLIPQCVLPEGWTSVVQEEAKNIWGKGPPTGEDDHDQECESETTQPCSSCTQPMARHTFLAMMIGLRIQDDPVGYSPPLGPPVMFTLVYNQRDVEQPANFSYSNLGPKWTFNWLAYIEDDPANAAANVKYATRSGGAKVFSGYDTNSQTYTPNGRNGSILARTSSTSYELRRSDGSVWTFDQPDGASNYPRKVFLTKTRDPASNIVTIAYDGSLRVTSLTDAIGQVTTFSYQHTNDTLKITKVTDPFGRYATFNYDGSGRLQKITDIIGVTSEFTYEGSGTFINSLTTPYGTIAFRYGDTNGVRWVDATDPNGATERLERTTSAGYPAGSESSSLVPTGEGIANTYLDYRNSFYWDKKAMQGTHKDGPYNYTRAKIYHWLHTDNASGKQSGILESVKMPLENRVWYRYPNQVSSYNSLDSVSIYRPRVIARVLDDGTEQKVRYEYNSIGHMTNTTDAVGRRVSYIYATNNVDLLEIRQTTGGTDELLASYTYNSQHLPLTFTDASGQTNTFTYKSNGHIATVTNAKSETYTYNYDSNTNYLSSIVGPLGSTNSFTYDSYGRVDTTTDSEGYSLNYDYDNLDRVTKITYPDSTTEEFVYTNLRQTAKKDRLGRWTRMFYDETGHLVLLQDPANRITRFNWCDCGSLEGITGPLGNQTSWTTDLQGRTIVKVYPDGSSIQYAYENTTSRLKSMTDARGQSTWYQYFADDNLKRISYSNAVVSTPAVDFTYDTNFNRVATMVDGIGTTTYGYQSAGLGLGSMKLASIDGSWSNDTISYSYDELGRVKSRVINTSTNTVSYDSLGRVTNVVNSLGSFNYSYTNASTRLHKVTYPNGQTNFFDYYANSGDQRLKTIHNKNATNGTISKFDYEYNAGGQITKWTQQADSGNPKAYDFAYDKVDQLISASFKDTLTQSIVKRFVFSYDKSGNRTGEQIDDVPTIATFNELNQMTANQSAGPLRFKGSISETGTVTVAGVAATMSTTSSVTNNFIGSASSTVGTNVVAVIARDYSNNARTNNYQVVVSNLVSSALTYDANGNMTSDGTRNYTWDAANRLASIAQGTNSVQFTYDGLGRGVGIVELGGAATNSNKRLLWCEMEVCEERDSSGGTVNKRFELQGTRVNGTNYFYNRDHLGSIREIVDGSAALVTRYDYDPYGRRTKVSGTYDADFGYTGHFHEQAGWMTMGLNLAWFRGYDPELGRWLSRDPMPDIEKQEGPNVYAYVRNNPMNMADLSGLQADGPSIPGPSIPYIPNPSPYPFPQLSPTGVGNPPPALQPPSLEPKNCRIGDMRMVSLAPILRPCKICILCDDKIQFTKSGQKSCFKVKRCEPFFVGSSNVGAWVDSESCGECVPL